MTTRYKRIDTHFRPKDLELYNFIMSQCNGFGDASQWMRDAAEIKRQLLAVSSGDWQEWIEQAQVAIADISGQNTDKNLAKNETVSYSGK